LDRALGQRLLFTDNAAWPAGQTGTGYRGRHRVERAFRHLKGPAVAQFTPLFHRTDSKTRVYAFSGVPALTLVSLLHRTVAPDQNSRKHGKNRPSARSLTNEPPWPGCNRAVDEFLAGKPERLCGIESDHYQKWCFQK
jgi:hypothetical protein